MKYSESVLRIIVIRLFILLLLFTCISNLYAQQEAMYSQYMFNQLVINPAYAGRNDVFAGTLLYRNQWLKMPGAPKTETFSLDGCLKKEKVGLGLIISNDEIGVSKNLGIYGAYAYKIKLNNAVWSLGLQAGFSFIQSDFSKVQLDDNSSVRDPAFLTNVKEWMPNFGIGTYYYTDKFYAGISVPHILSKSLFVNQQSYEQYRHIFVTTGYILDVCPGVKAKPSLMLKVVQGAPAQLDINTFFWFYELFAIGVSLRTEDAFSVLLEVRANKQLSFGYAYDYNVSSLNKFNSGSHELMLHYEIFNKTKTSRHF